MKKGRKLISLAVVVVLISLIALVAFGIVQTQIERRRAESFLGILKQVRVGVTDRNSALILVAPFRKHVKDTIDGGGRPGLSFLFDNSWLVRLRLAPYADFRGWMTFENGVVVFKTGRLLSENTHVVATVTEQVRGFREADQLMSQGPNHLVRKPDNPSAPAKRIQIVDDDTYPEELRKKDWDFELSCLTKFGGCDDARILLPNASSASTQNKAATQRMAAPAVLTDFLRTPFGHPGLTSWAN